PLGHRLHLLGERHQPLLGVGSSRGVVHVGSVLEEPCGLSELVVAQCERSRLSGRSYRDASCRLVAKVDRRCDVHLHLG
ncbi:MAG: hypothetical protein ACK559_06420, partial [bacterium]